MVRSQIVSVPIPFYGLTDLIKGITPTFSGWDSNPTDAADITDDDPTTACTTGTYAAAAWQSAYMTWNLGDTYRIITTGFGRVITSAGSGYIYVQIYDGTNWRPPRSYSTGSNGLYGAWAAYSGVGSAVRLEFIPAQICNVSPYVSMFNVLKVA